MSATNPGEARYRLRYGLDSDDPEFLRGCEVGYLDARVQLLGRITLHELLHRSNEEMLRRITEAAGRTYQVDPIDDEWMAVVIDPLPEDRIGSGALIELEDDA